MQHTTFDPDWSIFSSPINALLQAAVQFGANREQLLQAAGLSEKDFAFADNRVSAATYFKLANAAEQATGNPDLALYAGRISFLSGLNLQLYMATICHTFKDYVNLIPSVLKLWGDIGEVRIKADGDYIRLEWHPLWAETMQSRFLSDAMLSASASIVDSLCLLPVPVRRAHFTYSEPDNLEALTQFLGDDLRFEKDITCLYFDRAALKYQLVPQHYQAGETRAIPFADLFDGKDPSDKFWSRLRQAIVRRLPSAELSIADVASDLNLSTRSLQRRLSERKTSFQEEVQAIRYELARRYLADGSTSVTETAFLLGYGDQSAFSSAFKKWHGTSPASFRTAS